MPTNTTRILIAAEQPLEALALETMLRAAGYRDVRVTSDAREIVPLHEKWPFKLLVLDMNMRTGIHTHSSLDVLEQLGEHIERRQLAVLALTGTGDEAAQDRALGLGAVDVFTRPFTRAETLMRVTGALSSLPGPSTDEAVMRAVSRRFSPKM